MAPQKRAGDAPKIGKPKKARTALQPNLVEPVVEAIANADELAADLRILFKVSLAAVLEVNKAERHPYELEIVAEAEKALGSVHASLEGSHAEALTKQNGVISPEEHAKRTEGQKSAEVDLEAAKAKFETQKEAQNAAQMVVHEAKAALKAAQKEAAAVEKEIHSLTERKSHLAELLEKPFALLQETTSASPEGKDAVKKIAKAGKECGLDSTLLQTFPITCKKEPSTRSEFEIMMLGQLKGGIDKQIDALTREQVELEPSSADKQSAVESASQKVSTCEEAAQAASKELADAQAVQKSAQNNFSKADDHLYKIWADMKVVCDAQDALSDDLKEFNDTILTAFDKLKEKEPEPEQVEPEEETAVPEESAADVVMETVEPEEGEAAAA